MDIYMWLGPHYIYHSMRLCRTGDREDNKLRKDYLNMGVKARGPHRSSWSELVLWCSVKVGLHEPWYAIHGCRWWVDF